MATDGPTPPPCRDDPYRNGVPVLATAGVPSVAMERWVRSVAVESGQDVDWHFVGGRAVVKALGDLVAVRRAMARLRPALDESYRAALIEPEYRDETAPWHVLEFGPDDPWPPVLPYGGTTAKAEASP